MKTYQETVEMLVNDYIDSLDKDAFFSHKEWAEFIDRCNAKLDMAAFIYGTTRKALVTDVKAAAENR